MAKWKFEFEAPVGTRVLNSRFIWVTVDWQGDEALWWDFKERRWLTDAEYRANPRTVSSAAPCRSFKAFQRHLRKHEEQLRGREVWLVSRFRDHSIIARQETADVPSRTTAPAPGG